MHDKLGDEPGAAATANKTSMYPSVLKWLTNLICCHLDNTAVRLPTLSVCMPSDVYYITWIS